MSIAALGIRTAISRALIGATWAEARVFNSAIGTIDEVLKDDPAPVIIISTEDDVAETTMLDILAGTRTIDLVIEIALAGKMVGEAGEAAAVVVPNTDAGMEVSLNLLARQVLRVITIGGGKWGQVFRLLAPQIQRITSRRGADAENGVRFAARQIVLTCQVIGEPPFGVPLVAGEPWALLLDAMNADAEVQPLADLVQTAIVGEEIPEWRRAAAVLALSDAEAEAVGLGSFIAAGEEPVQVVEIVYPDGSITADEAGKQLPEPPDA